MLRSDCCGAKPKSNGDSDTSDMGICPDCGDHCEYIDEEDEKEPNLNRPDYNDTIRDRQIENMKLK